jgi:integrase
MASIRKRSWTSGGEEKTAWIADYVDQHKKRRLKTFKTKKAADEWLVRTRGEVRDSTHTPESTSVTVGEACKRWLQHVELVGNDKGPVEPATLRSYRLCAEHHVLPVFAKVRLSQLSTPRIHSYVAQLLAGNMPDAPEGEKKPRSRAMAAKAVWTLKAILSYAQRTGLVAQNVALPVKLGKSDRDDKEVKVPDREHVKAWIAAATPRWRPLVILAAYSGLRASELRALTWGNVDLKAGTVTVAQRADRFRTIGRPKSRTSRRTVPLMAFVLQELRELHLRQGRPEGDQLVFPTERGGVMAHANFAERGFYKPQRRAGLVDGAGKPLYSVHALRHFFAWVCIKGGVPPKELQSFMGHATLSMTMDVYGGWWPDPEGAQTRIAAAERIALGS